MKTNYQEEYLKLIEDIKYKLSKLLLTKDQINKYLIALAEIENSITEQSNFAYYEAFLQALEIEKELNKLIETNIILPPYESETVLNTSMDKLRTDIKKQQNKLKYLKLRLLSYVLTCSIFVTMGSYTILKDKEHSKEKLYLTAKTTYFDNTDKTRNYYDYQAKKDDIDQVIIKKITPWVVDGKIASRQEYIYYVDNMSYGEILSQKDYEKIIANLTYDEKTTYMPAKELQGKFRYNEPIFEITEITQNMDKYIEKKSIASTETILALFAELLIYLLVYNINDGPLFESILVGASSINSTNKIIDNKRTTLKLLKKQAHMLK